MTLRFPLLVLLALGSALGAALPAAARTFEVVVTHVSDGDTLWVRPSPGGAPRAVRLQGLDAPEVCQAHGPQARDALAARVLHQRVTVRTRGRDDYQRLLARVSLRGGDIGLWLVEQGHAWSYHYRRDPGPYAAQEQLARQAHRGLWAQGRAVPPREFRKRHGRCAH